MDRCLRRDPRAEVVEPGVSRWWFILSVFLAALLDERDQVRAYPNGEERN